MNFPTHKLYVDGVEVGWGHSEQSLYALRDELLDSPEKARFVREIMSDVGQGLDLTGEADAR